jgi:DNA-binding transcriptional ArsR family regulator
MVAAHEGGEACVCELTEPLGLTQPTISHHLKILVDAGILTRDKRGVWAYYALVPTAMDALSPVLSTALSQRSSAAGLPEVVVQNNLVEEVGRELAASQCDGDGSPGRDPRSAREQRRRRGRLIVFWETPGAGRFSVVPGPDHVFPLLREGVIRPL